MAVESVLKAWVFLVYHFEKQGLSGPAERQDASCFAVLESWAGQGALDRGMGNGEEERSSHAACWKREAGYSFGWTNGGAEDTLGFHGGHTLLQPLYGQGGTGAGTGGEVYAMDLRHCFGEGGTACPD